jgi:Niemann-Pick C1 protein
VQPYSLDLPTKIGKTLATAGASITVTSLTDIFAFIIGSNTTLPALRNFCFYAAFGILFDFFFQVTWFVAWLTMDEWRRGRGALYSCRIQFTQYIC